MLSDHLRVATSDDHDAVAELLRACYPILMANAYEPALLAKALPLITQANPDLLRSGTYYLVTSEDGRLGGAGGWTLARPGDGMLQSRLAHLRHFACHPDYLRCGVGGRILRRCIGEARAAGVQEMQCFSSLNAEAFYAAHGFTRVRPIDVDLGTDEAVLFPGVLMRREIGD